MAFCENCGRPLADGEVCNCTQNNAAQQTPVQEAVGAEAPVQSAPVEPKKKGKKGLAIVIVVLILAVAAGVALFLHSANGYKKPINGITKVLNSKNTDLDSVVSAFLPDFAASSYKKAMKIVKSSDDIADALADVEDSLTEMYDDLDDEYDEGWSIKFDYADKEKLDADELENINDTYSSLYDTYFGSICEDIAGYDKYDYEDLADSLGIKVANAKDLCKVAVNFMNEFKGATVKEGYTLTGRIVICDKSGKTLDKTDRLTINVIKFNGDWMIDYISALPQFGISLYDLQRMLGYYY